VTISDFIFRAGVFLAGASMFWLMLKAIRSMRREKARVARLEAKCDAIARETEEAKQINFYRLK